MDGPVSRWVAIAGENGTEVANLVAESRRLEAESLDINRITRFADGSVIAVAEVEAGALRVTGLYRPHGWRPAPIGGVAAPATGKRAEAPASLATIASPPAHASAGETGKAKPLPVINGFRSDRAAYSGVYRQPEDVARDEHGLTKDATEVMRSHHRQILASALLSHPVAERLAHRYLIFVLARGMLRLADRDSAWREGSPELGVDRLPSHDHDPHVAQADLTDQPGAQTRRDALARLRAQAWMTEPDTALALSMFANAPHIDMERAAALVATTMLARSLGSEGFRVGTHERLATMLDLSAHVREHFTPDKAFFARLPKNQKLKALDAVDPALAKRMASKGADDLSEICAQAMSGLLSDQSRLGISDAARARGNGWIPPYLSFEGAPVVDEEEA